MTTLVAASASGGLAASPSRGRGGLDPQSQPLLRREAWQPHRQWFPARARRCHQKPGPPRSQQQPNPVGVDLHGWRMGIDLHRRKAAPHCTTRVPSRNPNSRRQPGAAVAQGLRPWSPTLRLAGGRQGSCPTTDWECSTARRVLNGSCSKPALRTTSRKSRCNFCRRSSEGERAPPLALASAAGAASPCNRARLPFVEKEQRYPGLVRSFAE